MKTLMVQDFELWTARVDNVDLVDVSIKTTLVVKNIENGKNVH